MIEAIKTHFTFQSLTLKDAIWTIKLSLGRRLELVHGEYLVRFVLDLEPFEKTVKEMQKRVEEVRESQGLFDEDNKARLKDVETDLKQAQKALKDAVKNFEDIEFVALTEKAEHKPGMTVLTLIVKAETVTQIDAHKHDLMPYGEQKNVYHVELTRNKE